MQTAANVVPIEHAKHLTSRMPMRVNTDSRHGEIPVQDHDQEEAKVSHWINRAFTALIAVGITLLLAFGTWLVTNVNQINTNTSVMQAEFSSYKQDVQHVKTAVDDLRMRSETWATKDSLVNSKEEMRRELDKLKDRIQQIELKLAERAPREK